MGTCDPFDEQYDALLIRGACQYGKTREAVLLAYRAWWDGQLRNNPSIGNNTTFLFVRCAFTGGGRWRDGDHVQYTVQRTEQHTVQRTVYSMQSSAQCGAQFAECV